MMMNQTSAGSMSDALGGGNMPTGGLSPQFVNPASMSPIGMANLQGSPLANAGANMGSYNSVAEHMMPPDQNSQMGAMGAQGAAPQPYNQGGLVRFAEGGMPPEAPMGEEAPPEVGESGGGDLQAKVMEAFTQSGGDPKKVADILLQLVMEEIRKSVSPEELAEIQTPEGQERLKATIQEAMSAVQGGGGGGLAQGAPPDAAAGGGAPPAPAGPPPMGMAMGGLAEMAGQPPAQASPDGALGAMAGAGAPPEEAMGPPPEEAAEGGGELQEVAAKVQELQPDMQLTHINPTEIELLAQTGEEVMDAAQIAGEDPELAELVEQLRMAGKAQDTLLVFLTEEQFSMLTQDHEPSVNDKTGLPQFFFKGIARAIGGAVKGVVNVVKNVAKSPAFQIIAPMALNMMLPGLGVAASGALGLSAAWAPALSGAITGGAMGLLGGKGIGGALKGAALGGVTSGVADYLWTGNNPLSGMFSGQEGGMANNVLSAGGSGSTQLTGAGSGLGIDKSTLGTQFGGATPPAGGGSTFGSINASPKGTLGQITPPASGANALAGNSSSGGGGLLSTLASKAKSLIPDSTLGKVALGGAALSAFGGLGGGGSQEQSSGGAPPPLDPSFSARLTPYQYNPNAGNSRNINQYNAADFVSRGAQQPGQEDDPYRFGGGSKSGSLFTTPPAAAPAAARGGRMPYYAMGGLARYSTGGMSDVGTDHGYLKGPGDGVSDSIPATIGGKQPARLAGGEFVIPARIVSELGNGSSDAGASRLEQMMQRVNKKRFSSKDFAKDTKAYQALPA